MGGGWHTLFCFLTVYFQVSSAFQWTSTATLPDGTTVPACPGQDVTLAWSFLLANGEHVVNTEWHFSGEGTSDEILGTDVAGHFFLDPAVSQNVEHISSGGIRVQNIDIADTGNYSVQVNVNLHGTITTEVQTVYVKVSEADLTTDGQLRATLVPGAVYADSDQQWHVQLICGTFRDIWRGRVNVVWQTPDGQSLSSTGYENGVFSLTVPNPVVGGEYTCKIDKSSAASLCVDSDSPVARGATVDVESTQAKVTLLTSQLHALEAKLYTHQTVSDQEKAQADQRLQHAEATITTLQHQLTSAQSFMSSLDHRLSSSESKVASLDRQLTTTQSNVNSLDHRLGSAESKVTHLTNDLNSAKQEITHLKSCIRSVCDHNVGNVLVHDSVCKGNSQCP